MKKLVFLMVTIFVIALLALPSNAKKQIIWQNVSSRQLDCKLIDSLNYVIVGDDGKIISSSDGGETWKWLECGLRNIFYSVDFINLERGAVVGDSGAFALTTDAGKTWKTGAIDTTTFYSVKMFDENTIFASGKNTCLYKTTDFGDTWKKVFNGDSNTLNNWLFLNDYKMNTYGNFVNSDICFSDDTTGYAAGVGPFVLKTTDAGDSWLKVLEKGDSAIFCSIDFLDNKTGIVVGGNYNYYYQYEPLIQDSVIVPNNEPYILLTQDGGETWENLKSPIEQIIYLGVKIYDKSRFLILGQSIKFAETKDFGKNWVTNQFIDYKYYKRTYNIKEGYPPRGDIYIPHSFATDNYGFILAIDKEVIIKSKDYGKSFITLKKFKQAQTTGMLNWFDVIPLTDKTLLYYGQKSSICKSNDNGTSWDMMFPRYEINTEEDERFWIQITFGSLFTGHFCDSQKGFLAGKLATGGNENTVFSEDGGENWNVEHKIETYPDFLSFISSHEGFAIGRDKQTILQTKDCGNTWDTVVRLKDIGISYGALKQIIFQNADTGYVIWQSYLNTNDTLTYPNGVKSVSMLLRTNDGCLSFDTLFNQEAIATFGKIRFNKNNISFLVGSPKILFRSDDDCKTWEEILLPGNYHLITDTYFVNKNFGIASGFQDTLFITSDGGYSWKIEVLPLNRKYSLNTKYNENSFQFHKITEAINGNIFLVGQGRVVRGIIVDSTVGIDEEPNIEISLVFDITTIPNPVTNNAKINLYGLHYSAGKELFLRIYDINGNLVKDISTLANRNKNQNTAELEVELSDIPSGIYFIELESNNMIRVQKFIKE